jgi:hypothetical protein
MPAMCAAAICSAFFSGTCMPLLLRTLTMGASGLGFFGFGLDCVLGLAISVSCKFAMQLLADGARSLHRVS